MRPILLRITFFALFITIHSCKRYVDPAPQNLNLTNKYCNDPIAVNYNWNFPGLPDNGVCIYPADVFVGNFTFYDSLQDIGTGLYLPNDTLPLQITKMTNSAFLIGGLCPSASFMAKAYRNMQFTLDSNSINGQLFCVVQDTLSGKGSKNFVSDTSFKFSYTLNTPAGIQKHRGILIK
jgi:hypothetical protein